MTIEQILEEIREWIGDRRIPEKELEEYLTEKGFSGEEVSYIIWEMLKNKFSFMNDTVCYRGDYVAKMPPNQNPVSHEDLIKKYKGK